MTEQSTDQSTQQQQNSAYGTATAKLREKYREEYEALVDAEFAARGLTRRKRLSRDERAALTQQERMEKAINQFDKLYANNPELAEHIRRRVMLG